MTSFTEGWSSDGTFFSRDISQTTITRSINNGDPIEPGDGVVFTGLPSSTASFAGILNNDGVYLGTIDFVGQTGYVFGEVATYASNTGLLVLVNTPLSSSEQLTARNVIKNIVNTKPALGSEAACFLAGTLIATSSGPKAVEALEIGDLLLTQDGGPTPVKWVGRQTVHTAFGPAARLRPVRIRAGALQEGLPHRDLTVTADHALLIDGLLVNAGALVNGSSIVTVSPDELGERYTVYHVETECHDILLAEGAPAESFVDQVSRRAFENFADYEALYGQTPQVQELPHPRVTSARLLPDPIRKRLATSQVA